METEEEGVRAHLRAKLEHKGRTIEAYSLHITETLVVVHTIEHARVGDEVILTLSFPGIVDSLELRTQVVSLRLSSGPCEAGGWSLGFVFRSDDEAAMLGALLDRLRQAPEVPQPLRILLVEDSKLVQDVFRYSLQRYFKGRDQPLELEVATNGAEATELAASRVFDMAIVDYFLPDGRGDRIIGELRKEPRTKAMTVIAISVGGEEARSASFEAGADLFLDKPIVMDDLYSTLAKVRKGVPQ
jgi:CheY-like chemotaxis protein